MFSVIFHWGWAFLYPYSVHPSKTYSGPRRSDPLTSESMFYLGRISSSMRYQGLFVSSISYFGRQGYYLDAKWPVNLQKRVAFAAVGQGALICLWKSSRNKTIKIAITPHLIRHLIAGVFYVRDHQAAQLKWKQKLTKNIFVIKNSFLGMPVFLTGKITQQSHLLCFSLHTKPIWETSVKNEKWRQLNWRTA